LDLEKALALARTLNPELRAKRKELGIAEGKLHQASIFFQHNPELSLQGASRRVSGEEKTEHFADFGVELSQEFEMWGQPRARIESAKAAREAVKADIATVEWGVFARVRREFYSAQIASHRVRLAEEQFRFAQSVLDLSRRQLDAGEIARTDFRQLEIQTARLRVALIGARAKFKTAIEALRLSLGLPEGDPLEVEDTLVPLVLLNSTPQAYVEEVLAIHPRLRHSRLIAEQLERELTLTQKEGKPNITGSLFVEREEGDQHIVGLRLSLPLPLFNRFQGTISSTRSSVEAARAKVRSTSRILRSQAELAIKRLALSYEAASFDREKVLPAIRANLEQLENAFRQGAISMIDLRVNQRELRDAEAAALDTLSEYYQRRAEIEGLLGKTITR
jgi:cobalt-zinc-cadmium efflux system outer membrane protein